MGKTAYATFSRLVLFFFLLVMPPFDVLQAIEPEWCKNLPRPEYKNLARTQVNDDWFEVYQVYGHTYAIYEPRQYEEVISFLIVGNQQALLLDSGMGIGDLKKVVEQLTKLPVMVLNTHTHPDHIGNNYQFHNILGVDVPFNRENANGFKHNDIQDWVKPDHICGKLPIGFDPDSYQVRGYKISGTVRDGEIIDLGNRKVEVIMTAGHTPDSLCLVDRENGLLFTGDTFYPGPIYLFAKETDFQLYARSVRKIATIAKEVKMVLPAHNVPVAAPEVLAQLDEAVQAILARRVQPEKNDGLNEYIFHGFSLLLKD